MTPYNTPRQGCTPQYHFLGSNLKATPADITVTELTVRHFYTSKQAMVWSYARGLTQQLLQQLAAIQVLRRGHYFLSIMVIYYSVGGVDTGYPLYIQICSYGGVRGYSYVSHPENLHEGGWTGDYR